MSASHQWFWAKIRKPLPRWHFASWQPPAKCSLAETYKTTYSPVIVCQSIGVDRMYTYFDMEKTGACDIRNWRTNLLSRMNYIHAKRIDRISTDVVSIHARYQHLTFVIVYKEASNHCRLPLVLVSKIRSFSLVSQCFTWIKLRKKEHEINNAQYVASKHKTKIIINC